MDVPPRMLTPRSTCARQTLDVGAVMVMPGGPAELSLSLQSNILLRCLCSAPAHEPIYSTFYLRVSCDWMHPRPEDDAKRPEDGGDCRSVIGSTKSMRQLFCRCRLIASALTRSKTREWRRPHWQAVAVLLFPVCKGSFTVTSILCSLCLSFCSCPLFWLELLKSLYEKHYSTLTLVILPFREIR